MNFLPNFFQNLKNTMVEIKRKPLGRWGGRKGGTLSNRSQKKKENSRMRGIREEKSWSEAPKGESWSTRKKKFKGNLGSGS